MLSHPIELTNVSIYVPETVYILDPTIILSPKHIENVKFEKTVGHRHVSVSVKVWTSVSPNSEFIVDVNNTGPWLGFWKMLLNVTVCEFPLVVVLLSGGTTS